MDPRTSSEQAREAARLRRDAIEPTGDDEREAPAELDEDRDVPAPMPSLDEQLHHLSA